MEFRGAYLIDWKKVVREMWWKSLISSSKRVNWRKPWIDLSVAKEKITYPIRLKLYLVVS